MQHKISISLAFLLVFGGEIDTSRAASIEEARLHYHAGKLAPALSEADALLKINPESVSALFLKAQIQTENQHIRKAIETYRALITLDANHLQAYNNLAALYAQEGELELASETLERAILTDPVYTTIHINLRAIYQDIAKKHYRLALKLEPENKQTHIVSIDLNMDTDQILQEEIMVVPHSIQTAINTTLVNDALTARNPALQTKPVNTEKQLAAPQKADPPADPAGEIKANLLAWAKAWSDRDSSGYIQAYKSLYSPSAKTPAEWAAGRHWNFKNKTYIKVSISQIRIKAEGNRYRAEFKQHYESDTYQDTVSKEMVFIRENGQWKIGGEFSI